MMYIYISHQTSACLFHQTFSIFQYHCFLPSIEIYLACMPFRLAMISRKESLSFEEGPSMSFFPEFVSTHHDPIVSTDLGASRQTTQANSVSDLLWLKPLPRFRQCFALQAFSLGQWLKFDWNCWLKYIEIVISPHVLWKLWKCFSKVDFPQFPERTGAYQRFINRSHLGSELAVSQRITWVLKSIESDYRWRHSTSTTSYSYRNH